MDDPDKGRTLNIERSTFIFYFIHSPKTPGQKP